MQRAAAARDARRADVWRDGEWFVAQARGVEVASQGKIRAEAIANLREGAGAALREPGRYTAASVGSSGARTCCKGRTWEARTVGRRPEQRGEGEPWPVLLDRLVKEAAAQGSDPGFVGKMNRAAKLLAVPLPAAVVSARTRAAVARRCTELAAEGDVRQAAALLAGYLLAVVRWERGPPRGGR